MINLLNCHQGLNLMELDKSSTGHQKSKLKSTLTMMYLGTDSFFYFFVRIKKVLLLLLLLKIVKPGEVVRSEKGRRPTLLRTLILTKPPRTCKIKDIFLNLPIICTKRLTIRRGSSILIVKGLFTLKRP